MPIVTNKFIDYTIHTNTEILILGTFSHDIVDGADFFFGKPRNYLWHLLPICFGLNSMKESSLSAKKEFMIKYKIDFADIIETLEVPVGEENNLDDTFIDNHAFEWKNINILIDSLPNLKAVYFTRKTFNGIANAKIQIVEIAAYCKLALFGNIKEPKTSKYKVLVEEMGVIATLRLVVNSCKAPPLVN
jgi:G:T/U-mismatch repair DNA glycosylase